MSVSDLIKATLLCGLAAFAVYSVPVISQVLIIGLLTLLWLSCAVQVARAARRKSSV